jgi:hypothetical protein
MDLELTTELSTFANRSNFISQGRGLAFKRWKIMCCQQNTKVQCLMTKIPSRTPDRQCNASAAYAFGTTLEEVYTQNYINVHRVSGIRLSGFKTQASIDSQACPGGRQNVAVNTLGHWT